MSDTPSLFDVPSRLPDPTVEQRSPVHRDDPFTAQVAAIRSMPSAASQRGRLLEMVHDTPGGMTALEAWRLLRREFPKVRPHGVGTRLGELRAQGWLAMAERNGKRVTRLTDTGSPAEVFVMDDAAADAYSQWQASRRTSAV